MAGTDLATTRQGAVPAIRLETFEDFMRAANVMCKSGLVPPKLANKPEATARVMFKGAAMGLDPFEAIDQIDPIDGKPVPNAQSRLGQIRRHGHEAEFVSEQDNRDFAELRIRRREHRHDPNGWRHVRYTIEQAMEAGLLDEWVERKYREQGDSYDRTEKFLLEVVDRHYVPVQIDAELPEWAVTQIKAGRVKRKDNWWKQRPAMLRARCAANAWRMHFSELMYVAGGIEAFTAEEQGEDGGSDLDDAVEEVYEDDDIVDAELVEDEAPPAATSPPAPAPTPTPPRVDRPAPKASAGGVSASREAAVAPGRGGPATPPAEEPARPMPVQIAMQAKAVGVDHHHVMAALGIAETSSKDLSIADGRRVLEAIKAIKDGYVRLAEVGDGGWHFADVEDEQEPQYAPGEEPFE